MPEDHGSSSKILKSRWSLEINPLHAYTFTSKSYPKLYYKCYKAVRSFIAMFTVCVYVCVYVCVCGGMCACAYV